MYKAKTEKFAGEFGFNTAWISPEEILVKPEFLKYCEENRCGNYNANYACPPACGTPDEMHQKLLAAKEVFVIQGVYDIPGYNTPEVLESKKKHTAAIHGLRDRLVEAGENITAVGYGGCTLCGECSKKTQEPCRFPDKAISCLSAYCIDAMHLAGKCGFSFEWNEKKLYLFGMILFK